MSEFIFSEGNLENPPENSDLICGYAVEQTPLTEAEYQVIRGLASAAGKIKLTAKPLDTIHEVHEEAVLAALPKTVVFPPFSVSKKDAKSLSWVVDFVTGERDPIAFYLKPWVYNQAGVEEYWLMDLKKKTLYLYNFEENGLIPEVIDSPRRIPVGIYKGKFLGYSDLFTEQNS